MATDKVTLIPVDSDQNVATLRQFRNILQTTFGPKGSCKMIVSGGGYVQLTSASTTLLDRLEMENPICRCIGRTAAGFPDHGLYFGVLVSHLLEQQWTQDGIPKHRLSHIIKYLTQTLQKLLNSELVCIKVDFNTINSFLPLVKTIISSKCNTLCAGMDINRFCIEIVKVFLNCVDEQTNSVGRVYIKVESGPNHFSSHNGLLYQITEERDLHNIKQIVGEFRIIVFTVKLENQLEDYSLIDKTILILEQAIKSGVKIVACQKTVADEIRLYLLRRDIVLLERMGTDLTTMLVQISEAFPISNHCVDLCNVDKLLGSLSRVQHIHFNESDYILLQNRSSLVGTLLVQNSGLAGSDHLKTLTQQAISSLRCLVAHPVLTLGGGCLEFWLIAQINLLKQEKQTDKELCNVSHWVQQALLSASGSTALTMMDSVFHHRWAEEESKCKCGFVTRPTLDQADGILIPIVEVMNNQSALCLSSPIRPKTSLHCEVLVDSHQQKINVIISAFETFANLSDIGLVVCKD